MAMLEETPVGNQQINEGEVHLDAPPELPAAVKIVLGDFEKSEQWLASKQWALRWRESQERYEPLRHIEMWEGTNVPRSSLNVYTVAEVVQSINSKVIEGLFSDDPPFVVFPRKSTKAEAARAVSSLLHFQIEDCDFRQEIEDGAADAILFGTSIWKANWQEYKKVRRVYRRKALPTKMAPLTPGGDPELLHTEESDEIVYADREVDCGRPILELQDLYQTYVDPGLRRTDIRKAKWVISRITLSAKGLDEMRDWEGYEIPSEEELDALLFPRQDTVEPTHMDALESTGNSGGSHQAQPRSMENSVDPTEDDSRFEVLERWDGDNVIAILNRKLVIRDERNPFGKLPYFSVGWLRVPNSFYSMGVGITAGDEQEIQRGLINALLDEVSWNLNLPVLRKKGEDELTQNVRMSLGKFVTVEDVDKSLKPMPRLQAVPEGYAEIQASQARVEANTGANELLVQGSMPAQGRTSIGRTATGANLLAGGSGSRLELFVERLATQVIIPALNMFFEMDRDLLDMEQLREILDEEMYEAYEGDHVDILNARIRIDVLAASRMVARQRMAQSLPMLAQTLLTDPLHSMLTQQGSKVDVAELVNMWFDISGWKNKSSLIVPMTAEDQQRAATNNPGMQQMMVNQHKQQGQTDSKLQIIDADNAARAYREINRQVLEQNLTALQATGEPSSKGIS